MYSDKPGRFFLMSRAKEGASSPNLLSRAALILLGLVWKTLERDPKQPKPALIAASINAPFLARVSLECPVAIACSSILKLSMNMKIALASAGRG
jgi:hypothetical protein